MSTAFAILTSTPSRSTLKLADELAAKLQNVYVVSDRDSEVRPIVAKYLHISDEESHSERYFNSSPLIPKTPISWDKALYYFRSSPYEHVWFCEDDVLFESGDVAQEFVASYYVDSSDLLCKSFFDKTTWPDWPHWGLAEGIFNNDHVAGAFLPLCRISRKLMVSIDNHAEEQGSLSFIETMIPSLVRRDRLSYSLIVELKSNSFRHYPSFNYSEVWQKYSFSGVNIFHPVKSDEVRYNFLCLKKYYIGNFYNKLIYSVIFIFILLRRKSMSAFRKIFVRKLRPR